jgi:hypothetical protein
MTETSEHGFKSGHSEGERTRGNGLQRQQRASPVRDVHRRLGNEVGLWLSSACGPHIARCSLCVVDVEVSFLYRVGFCQINTPTSERSYRIRWLFSRTIRRKKPIGRFMLAKAASKLFKDYGVFSSLTVTLVIHSDDLRAYLRTATATVCAASSSISASPGPGTGLPVSTILCAGPAQANLPDVRIGAGGEPPGAITYFVEIVQGQASPATWCLCQRGVLLATLVKDCPPKLSPIWPGASASCSAGH